MQDILGDKTVEELQNTNSILADIQSDTDNLIKQLETEEMEISIEYAYFPAPIQGIDKRKQSIARKGERTGNTRVFQWNGRRLSFSASL